MAVVLTPLYRMSTVETYQDFKFDNNFGRYATQTLQLEFFLYSDRFVRSNAFVESITCGKTD